MRKALSILSLVLLGLGMAAAQGVAQGSAVLDNGLVRLTFDQATGRFEASSPADAVLRLYDAGPSLAEVDKATRVEVHKQSFTDRLGEGEELVVSYAFAGKVPGFRYELRMYQGKPWLSATAYLPQGDYAIGDFSVIKGNVRTLRAFKTRVYVNSGTAGGDSGVWEMGIQKRTSAVLSELYEPRVKDALGLGFYSFYRASTSVDSQYLGPHEIGVNAVAHYYGYRPKEGELRTESVLLSFGRDPLRMLTNWADAVVKVVQPKFIHDTRTGLVGTWYIYGDKITQQDTLEQARLLVKSILFKNYGIKIMFTGEWQRQRTQHGDLGDRFGFGEDQQDKNLFPRGIQWLSEQLQSLGLKTDFGGNYAYAALGSSLVKDHVPWLIWDDLSRINFGYPIDFTDPQAQTWLRRLAQQNVEYKASQWWDDFDGGPTRGTLHDPNKIMQFEDIREGLKVIRQTVGPKVYIHRYCCGPYFTYIGLADRVRIGDDTHALGDYGGFKAMARQFAANYMLQQRFWVNDADPLFIGGRSLRDPGSPPIGPDPTLRNRVRMRLQEEAITGSYVTIGENIADFNPHRLHLLTLVLPPLGQAARPLDLFQHSTPEIYDLKVKTGWDQWHVLMLQNWDDRDKTYKIHFAKLGLDGRKSYLVFRFWDQHFLGEFRGEVPLKVAAESGESYAIRGVSRHPWVLSTDMHLTQGGVELQDVRYDPSTEKLAGTAERHPGDEGHVVVYVPQGYRVRSATGKFREQVEASGAKILHLEVKFQEAKAPWSVTFQKDE
jgi:hypothetical protein